MTPWEPSKIPFLLGFAGILTLHYRELARTYWGMPRARNVLPLLAMGVIPFIPFFALKDFGQMLVFSGAYATLYLVAVRRWPQLFVFVGSLVLVVVILVVGALPVNVQEKVPTLATIAAPVRAVLPDRIKQRFHLWLDGFDPPAPGHRVVEEGLRGRARARPAHARVGRVEPRDAEDRQRGRVVRPHRLPALAGHVRPRRRTDDRTRVWGSASPK